MPEKINTLVLWVDLECVRCNRKIRRVICKLQERENIQSVDYDQKENKVILKGPFDPEWLAKKLCCKACKIIKQYEIVEPQPPPPPPLPPALPPPPPEEPEPPPSPVGRTKQSTTNQTDPERLKRPVGPPHLPSDPIQIGFNPNPFPYLYPYPFAFLQVCCHAPCPCYGGHGGCRCCSCGKAYDKPQPAPPAQPCCDPCGYKIVYEDAPQACAIM